MLDLCCGSGTVGAALLARTPELELHAVDVDARAVQDARRNLDGRGRVYPGDLFAPLPSPLRSRFDVVVASAPYVPADAIPLLPAEARLYEARVALDGGRDGLAVVRRIIAGAAD